MTMFKDYRFRGVPVGSRVIEIWYQGAYNVLDLRGEDLTAETVEAYRKRWAEVGVFMDALRVSVRTEHDWETVFVWSELDKRVESGLE